MPEEAILQAGIMAQAVVAVAVVRVLMAAVLLVVTAVQALQLVLHWAAGLMLAAVEEDRMQEVEGELEDQVLEAMAPGLLQGQMRRLLILVPAVAVVLEAALELHLQVEMVHPAS